MSLVLDNRSQSRLVGRGGGECADQALGSIQQRTTGSIGGAAERIIHRDKFPFTMAAADPTSKILDLDLRWPATRGAVLVKVEFGLHGRRLECPQYPK